MSLPSKIFITLLLALLTTSAFAQRTKTPVDPILFIVPFAAAPGASTKVAFHLAPGNAAPGFWATFPVEAEPMEAKQDDVARFRLRIPAGAPVGIGALRFMTTAGVSSLRLFLVDDIPTTDRAAGNTAPASAQPLTLPAAVEADAEPLAGHYYRFAAKRGQRVAFEVVAQRLNSRMDPVLRILDRAGRELAYCDDTPGLGPDIRFAHTFAIDGEYLIELRDADYQGGPEHRYRLRVGDFPTVTVPFPAGGKRGAETRFAFEGPAGDRFDPVTLKLIEQFPRQSIGLKFPGGQSSTFVSVLSGDAEDFVAPAANHSRETAARIPSPVTISGHFTEPGTRDFYQLVARKGEHLFIRPRARSLNSAATPFLQLFKPDGAKFAESKNPGEPKGATDPKPAAEEDAALDVTMPDDGAYTLVAQEITRAAGPAMIYRLQIERVLPGFTLGIDADKFDAPAGGTLKIKVKCARRDYDGPITLSLTGDAARFELKNETIAKGKAETDLEVKLPADLSTARPLSFTLVGRAKIGGAESTAIASTAAPLKKLFPRMPYPPAELDGLIGLGVRPPEKAPSTQATRPTTR